MRKNTCFIKRPKLSKICNLVQMLRFIWKKDEILMRHRILQIKTSVTLREQQKKMRWDIFHGVSLLPFVALTWAGGSAQDHSGGAWSPSYTRGILLDRWDTNTHGRVTLALLMLTLKMDSHGYITVCYKPQEWKTSVSLLPGQLWGFKTVSSPKALDSLIRWSSRGLLYRLVLLNL